MLFSKNDMEDDKLLELAKQLREFADEKYLQIMSQTDDELETAREKIFRASKFLKDSGLAKALGATIPRHIRHWKDDFENNPDSHYSFINASNVVVKRKKKKLIVKFSIRDADYKITLQENGYDEFGHGIKLTYNGAKVLVLDLCKEDLEFEYLGVKYLIIGEWVQDMLGLATEIQAGNDKFFQSVLDEDKIEVANNIFLDDD